MARVLSVINGIAAGDPRERLRAVLVWRGRPAACDCAVPVGCGPQARRACRPASAPCRGRSRCWPRRKNLLDDHAAERAKRAAFYQRQEERNAKRLAADPKAEVTIRHWTGKPTFIDQILTSLKTVFTGFLLATLVAVPLGILCGSSRIVQAALNPMIQVFRPVSPLAWLPIVTLIVSARLRDDRGRVVREVVPRLGDHRDAVLAVADADQHGGRRRPRSTATSSTSARVLQAALAHQGVQDRRCRRRCR